MRRAWFLCLLLSMAVAVGAFVADGSARSRHSPTFVLMRANDEFDVSGANVGCRVVADRSPYPNRLRCFRETSAHSYRPKAGSYAVELGEGAVAVGRIGSNEPVYRRDETPPSTAAAGIAQARPARGLQVTLARRDDRAFVAGTNIVCRPWDQTPRAVLCVLVGSDNRVRDGTYLAWVDARGVEIGQERNGKTVVVFRRMDGH